MAGYCSRFGIGWRCAEAFERESSRIGSPGMDGNQSGMTPNPLKVFSLAID